MYFGYSEIWRFTFVPIGFAITMAAFLTFCLVYMYGATRDGQAVRRYVRVASFVFLGAAVLDVVVAVVTGQFQRFVVAFGWAPLMEMVVLAVLCVGSMWFMAVAYARSKRDEPRK